MSRSFELPEADWATVGAVGEPGHRTFYIQVRQESQLITLKLEKQQVAAIAQFLAEILSDLPAAAEEEVATGSAAALVEPALAEWTVGGLQLSYDSVIDRIIILAEEITFEPDPAELSDPTDPTAPTDPADPTYSGDPGAPTDPTDPITHPEMQEPDPDLGAARIGLTRAQAATIARVGAELVTSGRPACGLCGRPMDPEGHSCPRTNGHKPN
jgi:uncharacterized repeat protein (TIGR03847 family)